MIQHLIQLVIYSSIWDDLSGYAIVYGSGFLIVYSILLMICEPRKEKVKS